MFTTEYNGKQYVFSDDQLIVNGISIPYSDMTNFAHRKGATPAFLFDYKGRRFALPYHAEDLKSILPYFQLASKASAAPAKAVAPVQPAAPVRPAPAAVPVTPAPAAPPAPTPAPETYAASAARPGYQPAASTAPAPASEQYAAPAAQPVYEQAAQAPAVAPEPYVAAIQPDYEPAAYDDTEASDEYESEGYYEEDYETYEEPAFAEEELTAPVADGSLDDSLGEELPEQKKGISMTVKVVAGIVLLAVIVAIVFFACNHKSDEQEAQDATVGQDIAAAEDDEDAEDTTPLPEANETVEATDGFTVTDIDGTIKAVLKKAYTGEEALSKLEEMGEDRKDFTEELDDSYQMVLYEYELEVLDGKLIGDPITGDMYLSDKKTEMDDWWCFDLYANEDKDLTAGVLELDKGAKTTAYAAYAMPANITDYDELVVKDIDETSMWVHYVLK